MRLPGTRYQEHGWEQVRKLLGQCSLEAFVHCLPLAPARLALYVDLVAESLHLAGRRARAEAAGNSYGESVAELALGLLYELQARPADWDAMCVALAAEETRLGRFWEGQGGEAILRKKVNDMYAVLRDKVDADNYQAACGRPCSANKMYGYRMLDMAYAEIARLFDNWRAHADQVAAIIGRPIEGLPIEVRQMKSIGTCRPEWILAWSAAQEQFGGGPGPLHTRSKRFANLKDQPEKIGAMLREIGDYEELSSNRDQDWLHDASEATEWLDDLWRVLGDEELCPAPRYRQLEITRVLAEESLPVRLAVYLKLLGPFDDSYPADWLDAGTGELPTMQQLALRDQISLPTLRKRRDGAIARLNSMEKR